MTRDTMIKLLYALIYTFGKEKAEKLFDNILEEIKVNSKENV